MIFSYSTVDFCFTFLILFVMSIKYIKNLTKITKKIIIAHINLTKQPNECNNILFRLFFVDYSFIVIWVIWVKQW
jgi:hypothetical protein